jgi:AraC-like DNA-binding protein
LLGPAAPLLAERLESASTWEQRFQILDSLLERQFARSVLPAADIRYAWQQILQHHGYIEVGALADAVGWSRRHFGERFRKEIGLAPKTMARVVRFNHALSLLGDGAATQPWATVASAAGYYDQAHLVRDFRQFTGYAPSEFARRRIAGMLDVLD